MAKQRIETQTYVEKRDELIDIAVRIANEKHAKENIDGENGSSLFRVGKSDFS
jgi:hypothetical protein